MTKSAAWLSLLLLLAGCFVGRGHYDRPLDPDQIDRIRRGVTTKQQVLDMFGPPQTIDAREVVAVGELLGIPGDTASPIEQLVTARYFRYQYTRYNGGLLLLGVLNYADVDIKSDTLVIFFDGKDVVQDFAFAKDTELLRTLGPLTR